MQKLRLTPNQILLLGLLAEVGQVASRDALQLSLALAQREADVFPYTFSTWLDAPRSGELAQDVTFLRYQGLIRPDLLAITPLARTVLADAGRRLDAEVFGRLVPAFRAALALPVAEVKRRLAEP